MSNWRNNRSYIGRYVSSGAINTIGGFAVIFALTAVGIHPNTANIVGYLFGLTLGFTLSKKYVFRSKGRVNSEGFRYIIAFSISFAVNMSVLNAAINIFAIDTIYAQVLAALTYTISMYILQSLFVFKATKIRSLLSTKQNRDES